MSAIIPNAKTQFFDMNGKPLAGGTVTFYVPGTTTLKDTWQDEALTTLNTNPVVLDAGGWASAWGEGAYRQVVKDAYGVTLWDTVTDANENDPQKILDILKATNGASLIGTSVGTVQDAINGFVTPFEFVGKPAYPTVTLAIQAMFDYAKANNKYVFAQGWKGTIPGAISANGIIIAGGDWTLQGDFTLTNAAIKGGIYRGSPDIFLDNSSISDGTLITTDGTNAPRVRHWGGDVVVDGVTFDGKVLVNKVASFVMQNVPYDGTVDINNCTFRNTYFGILQQNLGGLIKSGTYRNLNFFNVTGDCIELNVVQRHYENGCVIENIYMDYVNGIPLAGGGLSNWGIGIGVAGTGPYDWNQPDTDFASKIAIRNVFAKRCRQPIHLEVCRDCRVENVTVYPDQNVSATGTGLAMCGVVCYGCKDILIDGVSGEPVMDSTSGTSPDEVRMVFLEWGVTNGAAACPSRNMVVRNVHSETGSFYAGVAANPDGNGKMINPNVCTFENIDVSRFSIFGIASELYLNDIRCKRFRATGDDSSGWYGGGATSSNGKYIRTRSVLSMNEVYAVDDSGYGGQRFQRARYSEIKVTGGNVDAPMYVNLYGSLGTLIGNVRNIYQTLPNAAINISAAAFPTGREFETGDLVIGQKSGTTLTYLVTAAGAFIPQNHNFEIRAASVGATQIIQNKVPNGSTSNASWIYNNQLSPGCRIVIPGAGPAGADLTTTILRPPYQIPPGDISAVVRCDIADPIQTAVPAGTMIRAAYPATIVPDPLPNVNNP